MFKSARHQRVVLIDDHSLEFLLAKVAALTSTISGTNGIWMSVTREVFYDCCITYAVLW